MVTDVLLGLTCCRADMGSRDVDTWLESTGVHNVEWGSKPIFFFGTCGSMRPQMEVTFMAFDSSMSSLFDRTLSEMNRPQ